MIGRYLIINPGPRQPRKPRLEFPLTPGAEVTARSPGMSIETNSGQLIVSPRDMLQPGCANFVIYELNRTNVYATEADVMYDGKPCKKDPTFDMGLLILLHEIVALLAIAFGAVCFFAAIHFVLKLRAEKESNIRAAIDALAEGNLTLNQVAIDQSRATTNATAAILEQVAQGAKAIRVSGKPEDKPKALGPKVE